MSDHPLPAPNPDPAPSPAAPTAKPDRTPSWPEPDGELERRLREQIAAIERELHELRAHAQQRAEERVERERRRIAADLHDDLGAKLLTIVHTSESERISTLAREALEEMRLSVRGLTGRAVPLADALGDWRAEMVARLAQAGIACDWQPPDPEPARLRLSARTFVQATRILREAASNVIRHSGAHGCVVRIGIAEGVFEIELRDDGRGLPADVESHLDRGHGLSSMRQRALQLGGRCRIESAPGAGTTVQLTLPMDRALAEN